MRFFSRRQSFVCQPISLKNPLKANNMYDETVELLGCPPVFTLQHPFLFSFRGVEYINAEGQFKMFCDLEGIFFVKGSIKGLMPISFIK